MRLSVVHDLKRKLMRYIRQYKTYNRPGTSGRLHTLSSRGEYATGDNVALDLTSRPKPVKWVYRNLATESLRIHALQSTRLSCRVMTAWGCMDSRGAESIS